MQNAVTAMPVVIPICSVALVACLVMLGCSDVSSQRSRQTAEPPNLDESRLPDLPNPVGLAGPFAGASNGALIVAGGTNFPGKMPWEGGVKTWHDDAYVLDSTDGPWKSGYKLPRPLAYGVSLSSKYGVLCIGGNDSERVVSDVSLLQWKNGEVSIRRLPDLPAPMAGACGAILGDTAYVAGGYTAVDSIAEESQHNFWSLDLSRPDASCASSNRGQGPVGSSPSQARPTIRSTYSVGCAGSLTPLKNHRSGSLGMVTVTPPPATAAEANGRESLIYRRPTRQLRGRPLISKIVGWRSSGVGSMTQISPIRCRREPSFASRSSLTTR